MKRIIWILFCLLNLNGCLKLGHDGFVEFEDNLVGKVVPVKPFTFKNAGKIVRGNFLITGKGITHVTKNAEGNLIVHYDTQEILPIYPNKDWVGKCLIYYIVDAKTHRLIAWGFDKGGNPLSCRNWS